VEAREGAGGENGQLSREQASTLPAREAGRACFEAELPLVGID